MRVTGSGELQIKDEAGRLAVTKVDIAVLVSAVDTLSRDVQVLRDDIKRLGRRFERVENLVRQPPPT